MSQLIEIIEDNLDPSIIQNHIEGSTSILWVDTKDLKRLLFFLYENQDCYFDYLSTITAIDNKEQEGIFEISYHLTSIPFQKEIIIKISVSAADKNEWSAEVPSITDIYKTANWHEREIYDMYGIPFSGHPDLRRILMPADWEGFPLRKDYEIAEKYRGINIRHEDDKDEIE